MRRPFIAGNWKMNLNRADSVALAKALAAAAPFDVDVAVCPPAVYLDCVGQQLQGSTIGLGAQNVYDQPGGAYTGEISTGMLTDLGCKYVVLGHSERRHVLGETDQQISLKVQAALAAGLTPILCVGELLEQREAGRTEEVVRGQFVGSLAGVDAAAAANVVLAYEPVWAIGTGKVATPEQAEAVHADLRKLLESHYNADVASQVRIQYGGSVKPDNAGQLLSQPNIDGALVGGASLKADSFLGIISAA